MPQGNTYKPVRLKDYNNSKTIINIFQNFFHCFCNQYFHTSPTYQNKHTNNVIDLYSFKELCSKQSQFTQQ